MGLSRKYLQILVELPSQFYRPGFFLPFFKSWSKSTANEANTRSSLCVAAFEILFLPGGIQRFAAVPYFGSKYACVSIINLICMRPVFICYSRYRVLQENRFVGFN